ncbi:cadherin-like domain-containing protein [uncultured Sulfitobacter sp.]|uniref:beta strand repeat-containing protein n=1 Tax=uncultured Sulfitobacter sp. TaxID=191468 RepID=UPI00261A9EE3|nr:cadherin-like domain-containing protein [uncultured Sulfitobacter sp.]
MTNLSPGDLIIVQYHADTATGGSTIGDGFTFVLLEAVDASTEIRFTDSNFNADGSVSLDETTAVWTSGEALGAGTTVRIYDNVGGDSDGNWQTASFGALTFPNGSGNLTTSGDSIVAYQGPQAGLGQTPAQLLFGVALTDADNLGNPKTAEGWNTFGSTTDQNESALPNQLVGYEVGFAGAEPDNAYYNGPQSGDKAAILAAVTNPPNWVASDLPQISAPSLALPVEYNFSIFVASAAPTLDTNVVSNVDEDDLHTITTSELDTSDGDTADSAIVYTLDTATANGTLWVDADNSGTINNAEAALGVGGAFTQQNIVDGDLAYQHNGSETTSDSFQFDVSDGPNSINNQVHNFAIAPGNDAPVINGFNGDISAFNELFGGPVGIESGVNVGITDADDINFNGGTLTVSFTGGLSEDQLSINNGGASGIGVAGGGVFFNSSQIGTFTGGGNGADLVISFTSVNATPAIVSDLIEALRYDNSGGANPTAGARMINVVLNDGDDNSAPVAATVNVTAVNDNPTATGIPTDITVDENAFTALDLSDITVADPDSNPVAFTLTVSAGEIATSDGIGGLIPQGTSVTLSGTIAEFNTALATPNLLFYRGAVDVEGDNAATLTVTANDGDGSGVVTLGVVNIDITPENEAAVANDDAVSTDEVTVLNGDLFADNGSNADSDAESDPFFVTEVNGQSVLVGTPTTLISGATLTVNANGTFAYDPNGQFTDLAGPASGASNTTDTDTFSYTVTGGDTAQATVTINGLDNDDVLLGTANIDTLFGGIGNDTLLGGDDDDRLNGGAGADVLDGGANSISFFGGDRADYAGSAAWVNVSLETGFTGGGAGSHASGDTFIGIERLSGSMFGDRLRGDANNNVLTGVNGNDTLTGSGGADLMNGGSGVDTADYRTSISFVNLNLATNDNSGGGVGNNAEADTYSEIENLGGSRFDDFLTGDANDNVLEGNLGADALDGGGGTNTALYASSEGGVNVSLETGFAGGKSGTHAAGDTWTNINNFIGSDHNDLLNGDDTANMLTGGMGDDLLRGRLGSDTLDGSDGFDMASYSDSDTFVSVNLATGATTGGGAGNDAEGDIFISIEDLQGSRFADSLTGDGGDNFLEGRLGADVLNGGGGDDTASYAGSATFVNVSLLTGFAGGGLTSHGTGDVWIDIDNFVGSDHNDRLNGDNNANVLEGGLGDDTLAGNGGEDVFIFVENGGVDVILDFEDGIDRLDFTNLSTSSLLITDAGPDAVIDYGTGSVIIENAAGLVSYLDIDVFAL